MLCFSEQRKETSGEGECQFLTATAVLQSPSAKIAPTSIYTPSLSSVRPKPARLPSPVTSATPPAGPDLLEESAHNPTDFAICARNGAAPTAKTTKNWSHSCTSPLSLFQPPHIFPSAISRNIRSLRNVLRHLLAVMLFFGLGLMQDVN